MSTLVPSGSPASVDAGERFARGLALALAATLSLVAAAVHLLVTPEHFAAWWGYGAFFVVVTSAEIALVCLLMLRPASPWVARSGMWGTLATLVMYLVSRTAGIPLGPDAGAVEEVDALGMMATLAEAGLLVVLCTMLDTRTRSRTLTAFALIGAALWIAAYAGLLSPRAPGGQHGHGQEAVHGAAHGGGAREAVLPVIPDSVRNAPR